MPFLNTTNILPYLFILFSFGSCQSPTNYDKLVQYIETKNSQIDLEKFDSIILISENGACPFCSAQFTTAISDHISDKNLLFIVSCRGIQIDISSFIKTPHENIIVDFFNDFSKLNLAKGCAIIKISKETIDTIIEIQPQNLHNYLNQYK